MADNKNSANTLVCESEKVLYEKAVKKMKADRLIVQHAFKIDNYLTAAAMFDEVGAYLDSAQLAAKCRELAEQTREEQKKSQYQKALKLKEKAKKDSDYEKAIEMFRELGTYGDAEKEREDCEKQKKACESRLRRKEISVVLILLFCAGLIAAGWYTGFFRYAMGVCYGSMGYYEKAAEIFGGLDGLLDSREKAQACQEKLLLQQEKEEMKMLKKAQAGDSVVFAGNQWKVLERQGNQITLILEQVDSQGLFFRAVYHDVQEPATWEESSLRSWLNGEILETLFDEEERSAMISVNLKETGDKQSPGNDQTEKDADYITILNMEQAETYKKILNSMKGKDYWLQDQGAEAGLAAFVSAAGDVMAYGYPVEAQMSVRPVIMVDCGKLEEETK